ncbi:hypothetical protein ASC75_20220 [Aminobacter sp. DSM 101952]|uniref:DUF1801 domain-containing protein n=1 Tax=Aminobacter sp. DSM 101952 TaxID=2735891 RepID=UPI0006F7354C|nr:DUF1801 domain-containing protein [Aminobacter sp. DSM 101952]KQU74703.1 hypothetical protein ASC75_20220 [Aminobacter sp. DSM 101952]
MTASRIQAFLDDLRDRHADHFAIVSRLREIVLQSGPEVSEEIKYGGILFSSRAAFCGVFSYAGHVTLELSGGASLPDRHGVLQGQGTLRRHIKLFAVTDIEDRHVAEYVGLARQSADA